MFIYIHVHTYIHTYTGADCAGGHLGKKSINGKEINKWSQETSEKINPHKASGPDRVSARFLREVATQISPALTLLFNASILQSIIPTDWKDALINPIYKKGKNNRGIAENYRPISLTSVTCKLLEQIIHSNIIKHLEANTILSEKQHGFRKRRGCETQLVMLKS